MNFKTLVARLSRRIMDFDVSVGRNYIYCCVREMEISLYFFYIKRKGRVQLLNTPLHC